MSKNLHWKVLGILALIGVCLWEVYPPDKKLKPGIDLAGGTSLLYEIDTTGMSSRQKQDAAQQMIRVLQKRIDPSNQMNLIWRPQGNNRIEIQMPLASKSALEKRKAYHELRDELSAQNISRRSVEHALTRQETEQDDEAFNKGRSSRFRQLAGDSQARLDKLEALGLAYDEVGQAEAMFVATAATQSQLRQQLVGAGIVADELEALYQTWGNLDDANQVARANELVDGAQLQQTAVIGYMDARGELGRVREELEADDIGKRAQLEQAWDVLEEDNFDLDRLTRFLSRPGLDRDNEIGRLQELHPKMTEQLAELVVEHDAYSKVKGRLDDPEDLKRMLRGAGVLEFRILPKLGEEDLSDADIARYQELLTQKGPDPRRSGDANYAWRKVRNAGPNGFDVPGAIMGEFAGEVYVLASNKPGEVLLHGDGKWKLENARPDSGQLGTPVVLFRFNDIGAGKFLDLTRHNLQRPLCILLDNEALSAPNIQSAIRDRGQITGQFSAEEVNDLADKLNAGSLPARLGDQPISVNSVSATMGKDNIESGMRAGIVGLIAVAVFMLLYYLIAGALADIALFMNLLIVLGVMAFSRATFTMPGIAGLILTIGMAVDANVLIFERIREEQMRGSSLRMAIKNGYGRAFRTILDANVTTFITALMLWLLASEEVKGFALTLMIGIVTSMVTALFVTRVVFDLLTGLRVLQNRLVMMRIVKNSQVNWMAARGVFWLVSAILVIGGWTVFGQRQLSQNENPVFSIEFTGGTSTRVVLNELGKDATREDVEKAISDEGVNIDNPQIVGARVQQIGPSEKREFEITTTETNRIHVALSFGADSDVTAEQLQASIREAASNRGDVRMGRATVTASQEAGQFDLETNQSSRAHIRAVIDEVLLRDIDVSASESGTVVLLGASWNKGFSAETLQEDIRQKAIQFGVAKMNDTTVAQEQGGFIVKAASQADTKSVKRVVQETLLEDLRPTTDDFTTEEVVTDSIRRALAGKLSEQGDLKPTLTAQPITGDVLNAKPYLNEMFNGGVLISATFGENRTETLADLTKRIAASHLKDEFRNEFGNNRYELYSPSDMGDEKDVPLGRVEIATVSLATIHGEADETTWKAFVENETRRFEHSLQEQTSLPWVTQVDPSVGRKSMNDAVVAIVFSLLAIIAYIWARFGSVRFGMAAVVALLHDVSIAVGMVAASAWLSQTAVGRLLLISDFKIDLPMIAAFLTVIGYSLNDTIVVFDRIRENRGKLATLSPAVINQSINQVISRTILTSVTTLIVLVVMYIWGGSGLRGFNYVMIIGVLIGTYSSIGIATPLLYGAKVGTGRQANAGSKKGVAKS